MPDLMFAGDAQSPMQFVRGPHTRREGLPADAVTIYMDDDAAWNGQTLSDDERVQLIEWLTDGTDK